MDGEQFDAEVGRYAITTSAPEPYTFETQLGSDDARSAMKRWLSWSGQVRWKRSAADLASCEQAPRPARRRLRRLRATSNGSSASPKPGPAMLTQTFGAELVGNQRTLPHLAAIRMLGDWIIVSQTLRMNPAAAVPRSKHVVTKGAPPVLAPVEARKLLESIDTGALVGLRDRALLSVTLYSFVRVSAVLAMRRQDYFGQGSRGWLRLHEKGGKRARRAGHTGLRLHSMPTSRRAGSRGRRLALFQTVETVDPAGRRLTGRALDRRLVVARQVPSGKKMRQRGLFQLRGNRKKSGQNSRPDRPRQEGAMGETYPLYPGKEGASTSRWELRDPFILPHKSIEASPVWASTWGRLKRLQICGAQG